MDRDLVADTVAAERLGTSLRRTGYSEDAIHRLLGEEAYSSERGDTPAAERRLPDTPLATLIRLLFLQLPVSAQQAEAALGREGVEALETTGLAQVGQQVVPRVRILPIGRVLLASDGFSRDGDDPPDYVATYTPTARVLDSLTPRPRVDRALDVGTGSGIHALLAAQHARHVIATDVNPRAIAYTELNAALNGLRNIECRQGSLFDPVEGETFDLITCNAPYVVSPERRWVYRDSEFSEDEVSERVILAAAEHLNDGGYAGDQFLRAFESRAKLAEVAGGRGLAKARVGVASSLRLGRELEPSGGRAVDVEGSVELTEGTKHAVDASADVQEVVASLDSRMRLSEVIDTTADRRGLLEEEVGTLREEALDVIRDLLEPGAL